MNRQSIKLALIFLLASAAIGSLITWGIMRRSAPALPFGATQQEYNEARQQAYFIKASTLLRSVGQAIYLKHQQNPDWVLPDSEATLLETFYAESFLSRDTIEDWPGAANRPDGQPPFYMVGTIEDVSNLDANAPLLYEHPAHHPELGGSIVFADLNVEQLNADEFGATIREIDDQQ